MKTFSHLPEHERKREHWAVTLGDVLRCFDLLEMAIDHVPSPNISGTIQMEVRNIYISCMDTAYVREKLLVMPGSKVASIGNLYNGYITPCWVDEFIPYYRSLSRSTYESKTFWPIEVTSSKSPTYKITNDKQ